MDTLPDNLTLPPRTVLREGGAADLLAACAPFGADPLERAEELLAALEIRSPFAGRPLEDADAIVAETLASGSTAANPREAAAADVRAMLERIFGA